MLGQKSGQIALAFIPVCVRSGKTKQKATTLSMFSLVMKDQSFRFVVQRKTRSIREKSDFKSGVVVYVTRKVFQSFPRIFPISHQILLRQQNPKRYFGSSGIWPLTGQINLTGLGNTSNRINVY